jgi:hypothetical protein
MKIRRRLFLEAGSALALALMLFVTFITPDWIELVFGVSPDNGNGEIEWSAVVVLGLILIACLALARIEWRRARRLGSGETNV